MTAPVKTVRLGGKKWRWRYEPLKCVDGYCNADNRKIQIDTGLTGKRQLEIELHEAMHAIFPDLCEAAIGSGAEDLARLLWRLGYRGKR